LVNISVSKNHFIDQIERNSFRSYNKCAHKIIRYLNGDGIVNVADMCVMVDHWGENYSLCDIGSMPWGDGVVDVQDLIVLAEHLFEEVPLVEYVVN